MKFRRDFVTNSSSSSFVCDICGNVESGWDMSLQEAEMVECVNGHTICQDEMLSAPREVMLRLIQEEMQQSWSRFNGMTDTELNEKTDEELEEMMLEREDGYYGIPEECCPICQFIEYSNKDLAKYLEREYRVSRDEVFAKVKQLNKRRKKLYDSEYVTEVCSRFHLNPAEIVAGLKDRFGTYSRFYDYIHKG